MDTLFVTERDPCLEVKLQGVEGVVDLSAEGGCLRVPSNISLSHLPPCSLAPIPVEIVWAYLRGNKLSNSVFAEYEATAERYPNTARPMGRLASAAGV